MGRQERILNWRMWPPPPTHELDPGIPVVALIWWESGPELIDTVAIGWAGEDVCVRVKDIRWKPPQVWLAAKDVRRR